MNGQIRDKLFKTMCSDCSLTEECENYYGDKGCPALEVLTEILSKATDVDIVSQYLGTAKMVNQNGEPIHVSSQRRLGYSG